MGYCPDDSQPESHDPECEACREADALRKDAERYRWLRDGKNQDEALDKHGEETQNRVRSLVKRLAKKQSPKV